MSFGTAKTPGKIMSPALKTAQAHINNGQYAKARAGLLGITNAAEKPVAYFLLGKIAFDTDDMAVAAQALYESMQMAAQEETARYLGIALSRLGRYDDALKCLETAAVASLYKDDVPYLAALMTSWNRTLQPQKTIALYQSRTNPDTLLIDGYINALLLQQDLAGALAQAQQAAADKPDDDLRWAILEQVYDANKMFAQASDASLKSIALNPDNPAYHSNLGLTYIHNHKLDEAMAAFTRAIALDPLLTASYINRGGIHRVRRDYDAEAADIRTCLEIDPTLPDAHYGLGINLLRREQYEEAFAELEWFWHKNVMTSTRLPLSYRRWYGEDLAGKTLLVFADQGVGDTIMMARYFDVILNERNPRHVIFNVNDKLRALFEHQFKEAIAAGRASLFDEKNMAISSGSIDFAVAATSLPHVMRTTIDTIPHAAGYLQKRSTIDYKLNAQTFVIGISWHTKSFDAGFIRSLKLMDFAFLAAYPNVRIVNLQYGDTAAERAEAAKAGFPIHHDENIDPWSDLQGALDQIAACDLVISIDNTTVHTAGALGVPTWVILPSEPYWRWPISGEATPWYKSLRLFRHRAEKDYADTFAAIRSTLENLFAGNKAALTPPAFQPLFPAAAKTPRKAVLINDTGTCFTWGNYAACESLKKNLAATHGAVAAVSTLELPWFSPGALTLKDFDDPLVLSTCRYRDPTLFHHLETADTVVINGEGMMDNAEGPALQLMYLAYIAKHVYGRRTAIINHTCLPEGSAQLSDPNRVSYYLKAYKGLDGVCVRDTLSYELLRSLQLPATQGFDASVLWARDYLQNNPIRKREQVAVITAGPSYDSRMAEPMAQTCRKLRQMGLQPVMLRGAQWQPAHEDRILASDLEELAGKDMKTITAQSMEEFMGVLSSARVALTGFYQTAILAHAAGVQVIPVTLGSNAIAMTSLAKTCDFSAPLFAADRDLSKKAGNLIKSYSDQEVSAEPAPAANLQTLCAMALKNFDSF